MIFHRVGLFWKVKLTQALSSSSDIWSRRQLSVLLCLQVLAITDNVKLIGSWSLKDDHIKELLEAYPEHKNILECLMSKNGALHDKRHSKLAQIALASEEQVRSCSGHSGWIGPSMWGLWGDILISSMPPDLSWGCRINSTISRCSMMKTVSREATLCTNTMTHASEKLLPLMISACASHRYLLP